MIAKRKCKLVSFFMKILKLNNTFTNVLLEFINNFLIVEYYFVYLKTFYIELGNISEI